MRRFFIKEIDPTVWYIVRMHNLYKPRAYWYRFDTRRDALRAKKYVKNAKQSDLQVLKGEDLLKYKITIRSPGNRKYSFRFPTSYREARKRIKVLKKDKPKKYANI